MTNDYYAEFRSLEKIADDLIAKRRQTTDDVIREFFARSGFLNEAPSERVDIDALRAEAAQFDRDVTPTTVQLAQSTASIDPQDWRAAVRDCDQLFQATFAQGERPRPYTTPMPLSTLESLEQWLAAVGPALKLTPEQVSAFPPIANRLDVIHVPGAGTFVNAKVFERRATQHRKDLSSLYASALSAVTAERWGRRLIADETRLGRELARTGAWARQLRQELGLEPVPTQKDGDEAVLATSLLTRAGWRQWSTQYVLDYALVEGSRRALACTNQQGLVELMNDLGQALQKTLGNEGQAILAWGQFVLKGLLLLKGTPFTVTQQALRIFRRLQPGLDAALGKVFGISFSDRVALFKFKQLAHTLGPDNMPYAVLMVCTYDDLRYPFDQVAAHLHDDPELDVDLRLLRLAGLKNVRSPSMREIARAVRDDLRMSVPPEMFEIA